MNELDSQKRIAALETENARLSDYFDKAGRMLDEVVVLAQRVQILRNESVQAVVDDAKERAFGRGAIGLPSRAVAQSKE